ncbi:MAG: CsgG/HfaB family protein [Desulfatitalea sp.]
MKTICLSILLSLLVAGCSQPRVDDSAHNDTDIPFRHRWWNYYDRALTAVEGKEFTAAKEDLTAALHRRESDQRMARTYGMHFIDYFPHRELGVVYYLEGDLASAQAELEQSIRQHPTAKARFYLDEVRKALIQKRGGRTEPPQLNVDLPAVPLWTRDDPVRIQGQAQDPNYVRTVMVNATPLYLEGAQTLFDFTCDLTLPQGEHQITVAAWNLAGQTRQQNFVLHIDRQGPTVVVDRIRRQEGRIFIEGSALDPAGVRQITIDGIPLAIPLSTEAPFSHGLPEDREALEIRCRDRLENETIVRLMPRQWLDLAGKPKLVAGLRLAGIFGSRDKSPPILQLDNWDNTQTVYMERIALTGSVRDPGQVTALTINGQPALPRSAAMLFFSQIVELQEGANTITLTAQDAAGNRVERRIEIMRKTPEAKLLAHRLRLSIFAFAQKGAGFSAADAFQDSFMHQMVQGRRFQVVEREQLELLLQEQKISRTQLVDTATAVRLGQLAAAQAIVAGSLIETQTGIEIVGRVVDSETSEILATVDAYGEEKQLPGVKNLAQTLALKIHREFPLADGTVIERQGPIILTDLGSDQLRAQRSLLIYEERPARHPTGGHLLGFGQKVLGRARVTQLQTRLSQAKLNDDCDPAITPRHKVMPQ